MVNRKAKLQSLIKNIKTTKTPQRPLKETLQVSFKWHNFNEKKNKYAMVRAENGGGNRTHDMNRSCSIADITSILKEFFFPNGENTNGQTLSYFDYYIGDAALSKITNFLSAEKPFTLDNYLSQNCLKKGIFVLLTKKLSSHKFIMRQYPALLTESNLSDEEMNQNEQLIKI